MPAKIIVAAVLTLLSFFADAQEMKFEGTHPQNPDVLKLLEREGIIMDSVTNVKERDSLRKELLSTAWFYHGIDGLPISLEGLTKRQTKINFKCWTLKSSVKHYISMKLLLFLFQFSGKKIWIKGNCVKTIVPIL